MELSVMLFMSKVHLYYQKLKIGNIYVCLNCTGIASALYILGIVDDPYVSHKIMALKSYFHFLTFPKLNNMAL